MSGWDLLWIYPAGVVVVVVIAFIATQFEPTTHGRDVGCQFGCGLALFWPLAIIWFPGVLLVLGVMWCLRQIGLLKPERD